MLVFKKKNIRQKNLIYTRILTLPNEKMVKLIQYSNISLLKFQISDLEYKYIQIPFLMRIKKIKNTLVLTYLNTKLLKSFYNLVQFYSLNLNKVYIQKLILKGLGYKMIYYSKSQKIDFKLGYSHKKVVLVPNQKIQVFINKNVLLVLGYTLSELGNFLQKIRSLRKKDMYKGKGFWYFNEQRKLKLIKKM